MKKFLFLFVLILAFCQHLLSQAYQPQLLWTKYIGNQPGAAVISNDDKFIYCTEGTKLIKLDIDSGTILKQWDVGGRTVIMRISNDDKTVYLGCYQGLRVFDLASEKLIFVTDSLAQVTSLDISSDNTKLVYFSSSITAKDSLKILSIPDFIQIQSFKHQGSFDPQFYYIIHARFLSDGNRIVWYPNYLVDQKNCDIEFFDISKDSIVSTIYNAHSAFINDIAISTDGLLIASAGSDNDRFLKVWGVNTKQVIFSKQRELGSSVNRILFINNNKFLLTGGIGRECASIWDIINDKILFQTNNKSEGASDVLINNIKNRILTFSGFIRLYSIDIDSLTGVIEPIVHDTTLIYPNPIDNNINLSIVLPSNSNYTINLQNLQGVLVKVLFNGSLNQGLNNLNFDISDLSNGTYFINVTSINYNHTYKLIKGF